MQIKRCATFLFVMLLSLAVVPAVHAQDQSDSQLQWGDFGVHGSASAGYRFTTVKGYEPMFQELYDLKQGPRIMDFSLFGNSKASPFADQFSLTMSGLGGDPYPGAQLTLSKTKVYDLRVNWRQAYFYWNQNDNVILPTRPVTGLTDNHDWATVRKIGSVDLTLHATNNLRFNFEYHRTSFTGNTFTTFSPDYIGSPSSWGSFARAAAYPLFAPTSDYTNRFTGGLDYTWRHWNFHYNTGYQTFTDNVTLNNVTSPEVPLDTTTNGNTSQPLLNASWGDFRKLTTPVSEFSYNGKPYSWMQMRGSYIFYRYSGPATFDQSFNGIVQTGTDPQTKAPIYGPYSVSETGRATVSEPTNIVEQGFTFYVKPWWDINVNYRYSRFTTSTHGTFSSLFDSTTPASDEASNSWADGLYQVDFDTMFTPRSNLVIRPGLTFFKSDVEAFEDGVSDPARSLRWKTWWPSLSVYYQPVKRLSLRGEIHGFSTNASYTAITPHTDLTSRIVATVRITDKISLQDEMYIVNQKLLASNFRGRSHMNATTLNYAMNERYSLFAGFSYDSEFAAGDFTYAPGTTREATGSLRDQDINRVWQAGLDVKPTKYFGLRFAGNFVRATGVGEESGRPPVYGPLTFPYGTGTVYFDFPRAGRLSVDLQRTYYIQQITTVNNFSANLLTVRWTRDF